MKNEEIQEKMECNYNFKHHFVYIRQRGQKIDIGLDSSKVELINVY